MLKKFLEMLAVKKKKKQQKPNKQKKPHPNILLQKHQDEEHCQGLLCQKTMYKRCKESKVRLWQKKKQRDFLKNQYWKAWETQHSHLIQNALKEEHQTEVAV